MRVSARKRKRFNSYFCRPSNLRKKQNVWEREGVHINNSFMDSYGMGSIDDLFNVRFHGTNKRLEVILEGNGRKGNSLKCGHLFAMVMFN